MAQINKPTDYFNTKLYTGTGSSQSITGVGFQPDWVWIKDRDNVRNHQIYDVIRGAGYVIYSNLTSAEGDDINRLSSFDSDGFSLGSSADVNDSSQNFASWNWLASNTTASNTDGSITSTVSANTTSGFSIVSYTGTGANATVGHGIDTPKMIIVKGRNKAGGSPWWVYHSALGNTKGLTLNSTDASSTTSVLWNNTSPTSSVFSLGTGDELNGSGIDFIAYCFAEKKGFSKFGSYTGNGNADGTFVYTGFKPAWIMVKRTDTTNNWMMIDNKRTPSNTGTVPELFADSSSAENNSTDGRFDYLSNGLKARGTNAVINASGGTYIYMAFAESPLVGTNNTPATAR